MKNVDYYHFVIMPNRIIKFLKTTPRRKLLALIAAPLLITLLYSIYRENRVHEINAVDHLLIEYDSGGPTFPIFIEEDFKPGDCAVESVTINHLQDEEVDIQIRSARIRDKDKLSKVLSVVIRENSTDIYGGSGPTGDKTLRNFFRESRPLGILLASFLGQGTKTFEIEVCFDIDAGNKYQETKVKFDLIFFEKAPPIRLPDECKELEGVVTSVIEGTDGNDSIRGTRASELILAKGGNDHVDGAGGDDCIIGGGGSDRLLDGGSGNDIIVGGPGNDRIDGGQKNDIIYGSDGNDRLDGGQGHDYIDGGKGNDKIDGGSGNDEIMGGEGNDRIDGESGSDLIYGGLGNDRIWGGPSNDDLYGDQGDDRIDGDSGDDYLNGGPDHDELKGGSGTDTCVQGEVVNSCEL